jgi:hypothetical protein
MKRPALALAGLLSLFAALPAWAQPIQSSFNGADVTNSLPFGASTTPTPSQLTSFLQGAVSGLGNLFGINNSATTSPVVISSVPGMPGAMYVPPGHVVAPYPEQPGVGRVRYLGYFGERSLLP